MTGSGSGSGSATGSASGSASGSGSGSGSASGSGSGSGSASVFLCALCLLISCGAKPPPPAQTAPFARPSLTAPLPDLARPLAYRLHLTLDPAASTFSGEVEIDVSLARPSAQLWLHASDLTIDRVEITAGEARFAPRTVDASAPPLLGLDFGRPLPAGPFTVRLAYRGSTEHDEQGLFQEEVLGRRYLYSQSQAEFARRITPCFDEPRHKVPWQLTVTAPASAIVLGNAAATSEQPLPGGRRRTTFAATAPMPSYLFAVAAGPFQLFDVGRLGRARFPARLAIPSGLSPELQAATSHAVTALPLAVAALERWLELPLPLSKLDLVAVPDFFGAMENPGLITMNAGDLLGSDDQDRTPFLRVLVHELAHQWFGNLVTPSSWDDLWLSEGLATWASQQRFPELARALSPPASAEQLERDAAFARISSQMEARVAESRAPTALRRRAGTDAERMFDPISYDKGAATIAMLARWMGEARLLAGLRAYLAEHRHRSVAGEQLAAALGRVTPGAERVMLSALTRRGIPDVLLTLECYGQAALRVQLHSGDGPIPICARWDAGPGEAPRSACRVFSGDGELPLPVAPSHHCPLWVSGNDDGSGYYRVRWSDADPRGPLPAAPQQTRAERLGRFWELAADLWHVSLSAAAFAELEQLAATNGVTTLEQEVGELELFAVLEPWVLDDELPSWRALVERRGLAMLRPPLAQGGELTQRRLWLLHHLLADVRWPAALTEPAVASVRARIARGEAAPRDPAALAAAAEDWQLALRGHHRPLFLEYLAAAAREAARAPAARFGDLRAPELRVLEHLPLAALPSLRDALDTQTLRWSAAVPAFAGFLTRRSSQGPALAVLLERRDALARHLAPVELLPLLQAAGHLCSRPHRLSVDLLFRDLLRPLPDGDRRLVDTLDAIEWCASTRLGWGGLRRRGVTLQPPPRP